MTANGVTNIIFGKSKIFLKLTRVGTLYPIYLKFAGNFKNATLLEVLHLKKKRSWRLH